MGQEQGQVNRQLGESVPQAIRLPFIHPSKFAEHIGVTQDVIDGWIQRNYIPTTKVGRYRMINLVQIEQNLKASGLVQGGAA